jgi:hypothetical protein
MLASSTPAWLTAVLAIFAGVLGLSGTIINALISDRRRRQELDQARLLHASDARLTALINATGTALLYREQTAAAIQLVLRKPPRFGVDPMWSWTPEHKVACRTHDTELSLLFGAEHPVTLAWQGRSWYLAEAAEFAKAERKWSAPSTGPIPSDLEEEAEERRKSTQDGLDYFLSVAAESASLVQPSTRI